MKHIKKISILICIFIIVAGIIYSYPRKFESITIGYINELTKIEITKITIDSEKFDNYEVVDSNTIVQFKEILKNLKVKKCGKHHNRISHENNLYQVEFFIQNTQNQLQRIGIYEFNTNGYLYDDTYEYEIANKSEGEKINYFD